MTRWLDGYPWRLPNSVGHRGMFGHEFLEFEFHSNGKLRYSNNSHYKNEKMIRKECYVSDAVLTELRRIIDDSEITKYVVVVVG